MKNAKGDLQAMFFTSEDQKLELYLKLEGMADHFQAKF